MGLVAAKCPECGANISIDESKDAGICEYCGTAFVTEKVINNNYFNIINNNDLRGANIIVNSDGESIDGIIHLVKKELQEDILNITEIEIAFDDIIRKANDGEQRIKELFKEMGYYDIAQNLIEKGEFSNESYERSVLALLTKYDCDNLTGWMAYWKVSKDLLSSFSVKEALHFLQLIPEKEREEYEKDIYLDFAFSAASNNRYHEYIDAIPENYLQNNKEIQDALIESTYLIDIIGTISSDEKQERMQYIEKKLPKERIAEINQNKDDKSKSGGCYVATCVYGSYDCPQVWTLRRFRDYTLEAAWPGRLFIRLYYAISPTLVRWFGNTNWFKKIFRVQLDKLVSLLNEKGVEDTFYNDK